MSDEDKSTELTNIETCGKTDSERDRDQCRQNTGAGFQHTASMQIIVHAFMYKREAQVSAAAESLQCLSPQALLMHA